MIAWHLPSWRCGTKIARWMLRHGMESLFVGGYIYCPCFFRMCVYILWWFAHHYFTSFVSSCEAGTILWNIWNICVYIWCRQSWDDFDHLCDFVHQSVSKEVVDIEGKVEVDVDLHTWLCLKAAMVGKTRRFCFEPRWHWNWYSDIFRYSVGSKSTPFGGPPAASPVVASWGQSLWYETCEVDWQYVLLMSLKGRDQEMCGNVDLKYIECQVVCLKILMFSKLCLLSLVSWSFKVLTFPYQVHHQPPAVRPLGSALVAFFPGFVKWNLRPFASKLEVWMILVAGPQSANWTWNDSKVESAIGQGRPCFFFGKIWKDPYRNPLNHLVLGLRGTGSEQVILTFAFVEQEKRKVVAELRQRPVGRAGSQC